MSYQVNIRIPKTYLDEGLVKAVNAYFQEAFTKETLLFNHIENENPSMIYLEDDESRDGRMEQIQTYCETNEIPYDFYCGNNYEYDPEQSYFRPGMARAKDVSLTMEDSEYIVANKIIELVSEFDKLSKVVIKQRLEEQLDLSTSWKIDKLTDYTAETGLGRNKVAMSKIDEVLLKVDNGEIDIKEAMSEIKIIQEAVKNTYLVAVLEPYVDGCAIISSPSGEFGGKGYIEFKDTKQLVLGRWMTYTMKEAIDFAADFHNVSPEILTAYQVS